MRELLVAATFAASSFAGCVYPAQDPTGLELSWLFRESNLVDGDEARRVRTCRGAASSTLEAQLEDADDRSRHGHFAWPCELGFQTVAEFQATASDVFVELRGGEYHLTHRVSVGESASSAAAVEGTTDVTIERRGISIHAFEVELPTRELVLDVRGLDTCTDLAVALLLTDPQDAVADAPEDTEELAYREALESDRGLLLDDLDRPCDPTDAGLHAIPDVDVGDYLLRVRRDGSACELPVAIGAAPATLVVDLAQLPCSG